MTGASLNVSQISKRFDGVLAVDSVSLIASPAEVTGLIGPNGSGKTTTMNVVTGLYNADGGSVTLDGLPYSRTLATLHCRSWRSPHLPNYSTSIRMVYPG